MLPYPSPQKRIPRPVAIATNYDEQANTVTLQIIWDTPRVPLYRYNGQYIISELALEGRASGQDEAIWEELGVNLPGTNPDGETVAEEVEVDDVGIGYSVYARVRIGRATGGWGEYGYLDYVVAAPGQGGAGASGITELISITDLYETLHEIDVVNGCIQTYIQK